MSTSTSSLTIVKELHRLAKNPAHREYLLRNDVNSILIFVDADEYSMEVVSEALRALELLAEEAAENKITIQSLRTTVGFLESMKKIEYREGYSVECKALAIKIQRLLQVSSQPEQNKKAVHNAGDSGVMTRAGAIKTSKKKDSLNFLGGNKKAKVITLQIDGLSDQERRQKCVDVLVRVKGVISLTFNMHLQRCSVRAKAELSAEALAKAIQKTQVMQASQILKDEEGMEIVVPLGSKVNDCDDKELPPYLDEDSVDSPIKEEKAVARPDSASTIGSYASSWFGSVITAVNKNLYW